tara:strand:- start:1186 stop:1383 length:198 start_codon:yes stop_codon:yes gene_type:complete
MVNNMKKNEIIEKLSHLKGGDFPAWYISLSKEDKNNYCEIFQDLQKEFTDKLKYENGRNIAMYGI